MTSALPSITSSAQAEPEHGRLLELTRGNSKLPNSTLVFSLPSGHTCPGAQQCLARADRASGKIWQSPDSTFRCYSATGEAYNPALRRKVWRNLERLQPLNSAGIGRLLVDSVSAWTGNYPGIRRVRLFGGGDCYSAALRDGIIAAALAMPQLVWYAYTKNLVLFVSGDKPLPLPENFRLTASYGGRYDALIDRGLFPRNARVVLRENDAQVLQIPIDYDDSFAYDPVPQAFAHLVHATQPAGSPAAAALAERRQLGQFTGYSRRPPAIHP